MTGTLPKGIGARLLKFLADGWGGNEVSFSSKAIEEVYVMISMSTQHAFM